MNDTEQGLIRKAQAGDRAAFEELVRRTTRLVYARLYLETGDRHWAEDLTQETWLLAYRALAELHEPENLRPWLLAIARNVLAEALRRQARKKRTVPPQVGNHVLPELPSRDPSPAQDAEQADLNIQVLAVLRSLPEDYRLPLTLRYVTGADYETIGNPVGLVKQALRGGAAAASSSCVPVWGSRKRINWRFHMASFEFAPRRDVSY